LGGIIQRVREAQDNPIAAFLTPEQRKLFEETQRVMSLLEGFSDWVMDEVGAQVLPDVTSIRTRFEARRSQRRGALDRIVARLTGLDLKLEQYRKGEKFVSGVYAAGGQRAIAALWAGPWALPSDEELADPAAWVRRVLPEAS
jgi:putative hydrolase